MRRGDGSEAGSRRQRRSPLPLPTSCSSSSGPLVVLVAFSFFTFRDLHWYPELHLGNYVEALTDTAYRTILFRTVVVAVATTIAVLLIAYPFTYVITFVLPQRRQFLYFLVLVTLFGSYLVRIYAWRTILGREGLINATLTGVGVIPEPLDVLLSSPLAVGIALTNFLLPLAVLPIYASMQNLSPSLLEAARDLGAGRLEVCARRSPAADHARRARGRGVHVHRCGRRLRHARAPRGRDRAHGRRRDRARVRSHARLAARRGPRRTLVAVLVARRSASAGPCSGGGSPDDAPARLARRRPRAPSRDRRAVGRRRARHGLAWLFVALVLAFLFAPLVVVVAFSFNDIPRLSLPIAGLSLRWYEQAYRRPGGPPGAPAVARRRRS